MSPDSQNSDNVDCADLYSVDFTYPFLCNIDVAHPPASIVIPDNYLCMMGNMERQYWEIKCQVYNIILFFKKGKFYELYDYDAVIAHREFGLKLVMDTSNRGKMRLAGVPEQSYNEWARLFVFRGYKVGRVEQMQDICLGNISAKSIAIDDASARHSHTGSSTHNNLGKSISSYDTVSKTKVIPRVLVEVLTPGTLKDASMLSGHGEVFLLALVPMCVNDVTNDRAKSDVSVSTTNTDNTTHDESPTAQFIIDAVAVDLSRRVVLWCPCGHVNVVKSLTTIVGREQGRGDRADRSRNKNFYVAEHENGSSHTKVGCSSTLTVTTEEVESAAQGALMSTSSPAFGALGALLQHISPREIILPQFTRSSTPPKTSTSDPALISTVRRWVEAEGFAVDYVTVQSEPTRSPLRRTPAQSSVYPGANNNSNTNINRTTPKDQQQKGNDVDDMPTMSPAHVLVSHYFNRLQLDQEVSLLTQSCLFTAHLFSTALLPTPLTSPVHKSDVPTAPPAPLSLLAWERRYDHGMVLDSNTMSNLELIRNLHDGSEAHTLQAFLNRCVTNGGKRLFRRWLLRPSAESRVIRARQEAVCYLACGQQRLPAMWSKHTTHSPSGEEHRRPSDTTSSAAVIVNEKDDIDEDDDASCVTKKCCALHLKADTLSPCEEDGTTTLKNNSSAHDRNTSANRVSELDSHSTGANFGQFTSRMIHIDFERSLSHLASLKDESHAIAYVNPLVKYKKNLDLILSTIQAFSDMVRWARAFRRNCAADRSAVELRVCNSERNCHEANQDHCDTCPTRTACIDANAPPALLNELLGTLEAAAVPLTAIEARMDGHSMAHTGLLIPSRGSCPAYDAATDALEALEQQLNIERAHAHRTHFPRATAVTFGEVGKDIFLYEVGAAHAPRIPPPGMVERARSGKSVKYVVSALSERIEEYKIATMAQSAALVHALRQVAGDICTHCPVLYAAVEALSYLDCLLNLAQLYHSGWKYCCTPQLTRFGHTDAATRRAMCQRCYALDTTLPRCFSKKNVYSSDKSHDIVSKNKNNLNDDDIDSNLNGTPPSAYVCAVNLIHPLLESTAVPNDIALDPSTGEMLLLTGPNMAGKSTLMRTVAVNMLLAQLGGPALAQSMKFYPVDRIFTRIGARDITHKGQSTLFVELSETSEILRSATSRSLCLLDELGRGTSTHDGLAIAHATLEALQSHRPVPPLTIFSTHYHALALEQQRHAITLKKLAMSKIHTNKKHYTDAPCLERATNVAITDAPVSRHTQLGYMNFALGLQAKTDTLDNNAPKNSSNNTAYETLKSTSETTSLTFLYRLVPGVCERSYGVEVALLAGIPSELVHLARTKSNQLLRQSTLYEDVNTLRQFVK